jgi:succinate-semialdehyde dehydrogenase/glutarate-semialdehyde dehydrogenase
VYDRFVRDCVQKIGRLRVGNGSSASTDVGPLISERQVHIVETQVENARALGANILAGGKRLPELGPQFYSPTLITEVSPAMQLMQQETFGPVLPVIPFTTDDEAVRLTNASEFGLAASVFTKDAKRGNAIAQRLNAGAVMINDLLSCFAMPEAPHGGTRASGIGRTHGIMGMRETVRPKYIDSDGLPGMKKVWWYPYGETFTRQMSAFVDMLFARNAARKLSGSLKSAGSLWRRKL